MPNTYMSLFYANQCFSHALKEAPALGQKEKIQAKLPTSSHVTEALAAQGESRTLMVLSGLEQMLSVRMGSKKGRTSGSPVLLDSV